MSNKITVSPYDNEAMNALTADERIKIHLDYVKQPFAVEYAYPSSETARFYGMSKDGCWYVSAFVAIGKPRVKASSHGYVTRAEAEAVCEIYGKGCAK